MTDQLREGTANGQVLLASNEIDFGDLTPLEVPVRIQGKRCILREPSGAAVKAFNRASLVGAEMTFDDKNDVRVMRNFGGMAGNESKLISQCLYWAGEDGKLRLTPDGDADPAFLIPERKIDFWPHRIKQRLFEQLEEMCPELSANETEEVLLKQRARIDAKLDKLRAADTKKLLQPGTES